MVPAVTWPPFGDWPEAPHGVGPMAHAPPQAKHGSPLNAAVIDPTGSTPGYRCGGRVRPQQQSLTPQHYGSSPVGFRAPWP
jgi:hypothetical protein